HAEASDASKGTTSLDGCFIFHSPSVGEFRLCSILLLALYLGLEGRFGHVRTYLWRSPGGRSGRLFPAGHNTDRALFWMRNVRVQVASDELVDGSGGRQRGDRHRRRAGTARRR